MDSNVKQFLSDRRISIAELSKKAAGDSTETAAQRRERLRNLAITKRVSILVTPSSIIVNLVFYLYEKEAESRQLRMEDHYESNVQENYALLTNLHEACFTKCS